MTQGTNVLGADFRESVTVKLVLINQARKGRFLLANIFPTLDLPNYGTLFKLFDMVLKELGFQPLIKRFTNDLDEFALNGSNITAFKLNRDTFTYPFK